MIINYFIEKYSVDLSDGTNATWNVFGCIQNVEADHHITDV